MGLELHELSFSYGFKDKSAPTLKQVNMKVEPGKLCVLYGQSGSGKSTLAYLAAGLLKADEGSVLLDGSPIEAGMVGMVFQNAEQQLFAESVYEEVAFGPKNLGLHAKAVHERVHTALELVGLDPNVYEERSPFSLSGGEAKRLAIASVIAMDPSYYIFDEPTAGLDGRAIALFLRLLTKLLDQGKGIILISHELDWFLDYLDYIYLMHEGALSFAGSFAELLDNLDVCKQANLKLPYILELYDDLRKLGYQVPKPVNAESLATFLVHLRDSHA
ncbi:MAG: ATP-binding cassette domain-containing protein [Coriobacteriia bacterium]|nr:ATP-binding cassette domain-containing protein [Coriobacteriia bacterium]